MIYLIDKTTWKMFGYVDNLDIAKKAIKDVGKSIDDFFVLTEFGMKWVNRITYVDGECVYNKISFWTRDLSNILDNFEEHDIKTFLGEKETVTKNRFIAELNNIMSRVSSIDGRAGQIEYNMQVGKEFVSLFREECILTNFTKDSDTSPMKIFEKLTPVIAMLDAGAFREAKQYLAGYRQMLKDDFLTDERIDKYIAMLDAADAIEYATEEDYFYTAPETEA